MKILLDESVPRLLKLRLPHLDISTVQEMGWAGVRNGELLRRAEEQFEIFITADQSLRYQQNLSGRTIAILALPSNQVPLRSTRAENRSAIDDDSTGNGSGRTATLAARERGQLRSGKE